MKHRFHEDIKLLKQKILEMSFMAEEAVSHACDALFSGDEDLAQEVIQNEPLINSLEIEIDERGHSLFVLGQPMAGDLRLITMILKINTDLERMGDHAVNIAEKSLFIMKEPPFPIGEQMEKMSGAVQRMLRDALDAFLKEDEILAQTVLKRDDEVDDYNKKLYYQISEVMGKDSSRVNAGVNLLMVSHNLERIADLSSNIAEDVIYLKQGREVRHRVQTG